QSFDRVLVAVGRRAVSGSLGLESTKAKVTDRGFVAIDECCRTSDPHLYAVGDVTGEPMLAHRAMRQGKVAAECIAGRPSAFDNLPLPPALLTHPHIPYPARLHP